MFLNILVKILLILTYYLGLIDQTMNNSPRYVMWVVGIEMLIASCMVAFWYTFMASLEPPLMTKISGNGRVLLSSNSTVNFMVGIKLFSEEIAAILLVHAS
jgi:hypothetical protein